MEVGLLGSLEVTDAKGANLPISGAKLRALLTLLALDAGRVVPTDRLVECLWGEDPPSGVRNALQALVSKLRRALGENAVVDMQGGGYVLELPVGAVDTGRFEQLLAEARTALGGGDRDRGVDLLTAADSLWRGDALSDFAYEDFAAPAIARLSELRLVAIEERVAIELELGRHQGVVAELEALVGTHPLREGLRAQLMLALYRAGRQADALRVFQEGRTILAEELGLEPGPELRRLEAAILAQDDALGAPAAVVRTALPASTGNLRERLTTFIGRDDEAARVVAELSAHRLVTLIGPGGAGKTRLAVEVAASLVDRFPGGTWLVELAGVRDAEAVAPAIAGALWVADGSDVGERSESTLERLISRLRGQPVLIVLDNCEHVIGECAAIAETLVAQVPDLRVVATSREALGVPGEVLAPVGGLLLDAAVSLFADRAAAARPDFVVDDDTFGVVEDIARRLDGLPLALELAAARLRSLPLTQLADRLGDRFRLLTGGARTALPRQQTLRAVVDWSYELLFEDERRLFGRLAVFTGGCDLESVEMVCADELLDAADCLDLLGRLVDKSLVTVEFTADGARYSQLQTLWQYARERLAESPDSEAVRTRHAHWFLAIGVAARLELRGAQGVPWRRRLDAELDNLQAALDWFVDHDQPDEANRLAAGISWLWFIHADHYEGVRWLDRALSSGGGSPSVRATAAAWRALYAATVEGPHSALAEGRAAVDVLRSDADSGALSDSLLILSELHNRVGDLEGSLAALAEARPLIDDDEYALGVHDIQLAGSLAPLGDLEGAEAKARSGVEHLRTAGDEWLVVEGLGLLAGLTEAAGDLEGAATSYEELLEVGRARGMRGYEALCLIRLAAIRARWGDDESALPLFLEASTIRQRPAFTAAALIGLAGAARRLGRLDSARDALDEASAIYESIDYEPGRAAALTGWAWIALASDDGDGATRFATQACQRAARGADKSMRLSAEITERAVAVMTDDTEAHRSQLRELVERRSVHDGGRFVAIRGGAVGASLDEPDIKRLIDSFG